MTRVFRPPTEFEMVNRGLGLSPDHDPDGGVLEYTQTYGNGKELLVRFQIGIDLTVCAIVLEG